MTPESPGAEANRAATGAGIGPAPGAFSPDDGARLSVKDLARTFETDNGGVVAVGGISFDIEPGEFFTLLGPSGCGKSTTLRCVAGLETPDSGRITVDDRVLFDGDQRVSIPAHERAIGMVFQNYAIWPHMTVYDHVAFPLKMARKPRVSKKEMDERVKDALSKVGLGDYGSRIATKLSGGQQQRLALARALVAKPRLLLLDEPLSNLDASLRERMRDELRSLQQLTGVTTLYVTHDQAEAFGMSSRIAVMEAGSIVQVATPLEVYTRPASQYVATFVGKANLLVGRVDREEADGLVWVHTPVGSLLASAPPTVDRSGEVGVVIRPEDIGVSEFPPPGGSENPHMGTIVQAAFLGEIIEYVVQVGDVIVTSRQHPANVLREGSQVHIWFPASRCVVVEDPDLLQIDDREAVALDGQSAEPRR